MNQSILKIQNKVRAEAMAKVKCVVVAEKDKLVVIDSATDFIDANYKLCGVLERFFNKNPNAEGHSFDLVPLSRVVEQGQTYTHDDVVFVP